MLDISNILCLNETVVLRGLADKFWALDTSSGNQYKLNEVSYFILNLLRTPATIEQVVDEILKEYTVPRERAVSDCSRVLQFAIEKNIVKEVKA